MLPKIHKDPNKWTVPNRIPPGRPIVSDCSSESYSVSEYIDHYLCPLATSHPSYLKDTGDFLHKISQVKVPDDVLLITLDVDSLYTNIDNQAGLEAVKQKLHDNPERGRPDKELLELLESVKSGQPKREHDADDESDYTHDDPGDRHALS